MDNETNAPDEAALCLPLRGWLTRGFFSSQQLGQALRQALMTNAQRVYLGEHDGQACYLIPKPTNVPTT